MHIVLLGCPGAGKGTQSKILGERYGLAHIATGDLFRAEIAKKTPVGLKVQDYLKSGTLVPDAVVVEMVAHHLDASPQGWLLDGFPRTLEQAQALDQYLKKAGGTIDLCLHLHMDEKAVLERLTSRRGCAQCGELYNVATKPPQAEGKCDKCGGELKQREDDAAATVKKRLMVYEDLTKPLVAYYKAEQVFQEIDGSRPPEQVAEALMAVIDQAGVKR